MIGTYPTAIVDCNSENIDEIDFSDCEDLTLWHFNPKSQSLKDLSSTARYVKELKIYWSNITDFSGIEQFVNLRRLETAYLRKLSSLKGLPDGITFLMIENSRNLVDYSDLKRLVNIEVLRIHKSGALENLSFLNELSNIYEFLIFETPVSDGNMTPLLEHSPKLKSVYFSNKRYYSHKLQQIKAELGISD